MSKNEHKIHSVKTVHVKYLMPVHMSGVLLQVSVLWCVLIFNVLSSNCDILRLLFCSSWY